ncbi:MAG: TRC40/GET3/ArsA family transport-energizing ATPase [Promethearchaeati archaeon SRVP18_Atabeyarchaeia-1]
MTLETLVDSGKRFLLFGGKGGVGKTSCAAATSVWAANRGYDVLAISTDPAHSLGVIFNQKIGPEVKAIKGVKNLSGLEIDPKVAYGQLQGELSKTGKQDLSSLGIDSMSDLDVGAPPGADEALAFAKVLEYIEKPDHDLIVFDTAPTGHTLRLLSLPDVLNSWLGKMIKLRFTMGKIWGGLKSLVGRGAEEKDDSMKALERMKGTVEKARAELSNKDRTSFVPVMIPEAMAVEQTEMLLTALYEFEIPVSHLIVNMIFPEDVSCKFCEARKKMQDRHLVEIRRLYSDQFRLTELPLLEAEVRGLDEIKHLSKYLFADKS